MDKNRIPDNVETIHLIAVCGTGMGALACMLQELGFTVTGSDQNVYPPMSQFLAQKGITVAKGFDGANLAHRPDLVVVGNAVTRDNPESIRMFEMGLHYCSMPQALNHFIAADKKAVMVTGTHGKTSTASLIAWILTEAGLDPTFMIGGILNNFDSNYRLGQGAYFVVEGDEYDTAFFDKGPKFLHFQPHLAVVTSIEFDHADIFRDLDHVKDVFQKLIERASTKSTLIAYDADENVQSMIGLSGCQRRSKPKRRAITPTTPPSGPKAPPVKREGESRLSSRRRPSLAKPLTGKEKSGPWAKFQAKWKAMGSHNEPESR